jgi:hypothetical protein
MRLSRTCRIIQKWYRSVYFHFTYNTHSIEFSQVGTRLTKD